MEQVQIWEAIEAGEQAHDDLSSAYDKLCSAAGWGWLDVFGGKMIVTAIKRQRMSEADALMDRAQRSLSHFADVLQNYGMLVPDRIGGTLDALDVFDWFLDNPITDMMVQSRISQAKTTVQQMLEDLEVELNRLHTYAEQTAGR
ncbi:MAG: hypothetical protein MR707_05665 [Galactobacillus timonensis]|uniref:hypothetical protein n=1 Tax=Galactobacillus timonensis TaxID=2041840 RepID=UPI0023F42C22|nr:hypothetical protein [Galactobacillus timonensis]MCI6067701.1 hypothetical protein [Galactobacillus timonensis]MCI6753552.1 hypothetical protein [Galactobacillus timonensis]MDD7087540.1 hypothetical protein [Galactobacillus timonensis]MDY5222181.1 hypothetical protein [Lachnospiraceae bacterium]